MKLPKLGAIVLSIGAALTTMTASPSRATGPTDAQVWSACKAVANRDYTATQMTICKNHPKFAALTPSPKYGKASGQNLSKTAVRKAIASGKIEAPKTSACPSGSGKHSMQYQWTKHSLLGSVQYHWNLLVYYCREPNKYNGKITKMLSAQDWVTNAQTNVQIEGIPAQGDIPRRASDGSQGSWFRQRHIELCILKYGCYANLYPEGTETAWQAFSFTSYTGQAG